MLAEKIIKLLISLSYIPVYFIILNNVGINDFSNLILLFSYLSFLSVLDLGSANNPFFNRKNFFDKKYYLCILLLIYVTNFYLQDYFFEEDLNNKVITLLIVLVSFLMYITNRARIIVDLYCTDNYYLSVVRSLLPFVRWFALYVITLINFTILKFLVTLFIVEFIYLVFLYNYFINNNSQEVSDNLEEDTFKIFFNWLGNLFFSSFDIYLRFIMVQYSKPNNFLIYDLISRSLFVINILGTYLIRIIRVKKIDLSKLCYVLIVFQFLFILLELEITFKFLLIVSCVSVLSIILIANKKYYYLFLNKLTMVFLLSHEIFYSLK